MDTPTKKETWLQTHKIKALEQALETIAEHWPTVRGTQYDELHNAFECTSAELRCRLRELEQADQRAIADKLRERFEG